MDQKEIWLLQRLLGTLNYARRRRLGLIVGRPRVLFRTHGTPGHKKLVPCQRTRRCAVLFASWLAGGMRLDDVIVRSRKLGLRNMVGRQRILWTTTAVLRLLEAWLQLPADDRRETEEEVARRWPERLAVRQKKRKRKPSAARLVKYQQAAARVTG